MQDDVDFTEDIRNFSGKIYAIYGDRGYPDYNKKIEDLCLPIDIIKKITIFFISNACHMPMIENPDELAELINKIIMD